MTEEHEKWIESVDNALMDLRTINRDLGIENDSLRADNARLEAENAKMREALEKIANHSWYPELNYGVTIFDPHWYEGKYYDFKEIAREALEVKEQK